MDWSKIEGGKPGLSRHSIATADGFGVVSLGFATDALACGRGASLSFVYVPVPLPISATASTSTSSSGITNAGVETPVLAGMLFGKASTRAAA